MSWQEHIGKNLIKNVEVTIGDNKTKVDVIDGKLKIQSKLRATSIHLEQTRRTSGKNTVKSSTGHVRYSVGEADVYMFSRPDVEDYINISKWEYIAIPEKELIDPSNPQYLLPRVNKSIWKKYIGKANEVLESAYNSKK